MSLDKNVFVNGEKIYFRYQRELTNSQDSKIKKKLSDSEESKPSNESSLPKIEKKLLSAQLRMSLSKSISGAKDQIPDMMKKFYRWG